MNDIPPDNLGNIDQMVDQEYEDRMLPVGLTDRERLELGSELAAAIEDAHQAALQRKAAAEEYKGKIDKAYERANEAARKLRSGKKEAKVQVRITRNYREGWIETRRMDTDEQLSHRPMTGEERQMGMDFPRPES